MKIKTKVNILDYLRNIVTSQHPAHVSFENGRRRFVQVSEAASLLKLHEAVKPQTQADLEQTLRRNQCYFDRIVGFAQEKF